VFVIVDEFYCEHCGERIDDTDWLEAPCGEKVCEACCGVCAREHDPYHACMYRREAGL